jgi:RPA family protein
MSTRPEFVKKALSNIIIFWTVTDKPTALRRAERTNEQQESRQPMTIGFPAHFSHPIENPNHHKKSFYM